MRSKFYTIPLRKRSFFFLSCASGCLVVSFANRDGFLAPVPTLLARSKSTRTWLLVAPPARVLMAATAARRAVTIPREATTPATLTVATVPRAVTPRAEMALRAVTPLAVTPLAVTIPRAATTLRVVTAPKVATAPEAKTAPGAPPPTAPTAQTTPRRRPRRAAPSATTSPRPPWPPASSRPSSSSPASPQPCSYSKERYTHTPSVAGPCSCFCAQKMAISLKNRGVSRFLTLE